MQAYNIIFLAFFTTTIHDHEYDFPLSRRQFELAFLV